MVIAAPDRCWRRWQARRRVPAGAARTGRLRDRRSEQSPRSSCRRAGALPRSSVHDHVGGPGSARSVRPVEREVDWRSQGVIGAGNDAGRGAGHGVDETFGAARAVDARCQAGHRRAGGIDADDPSAPRSTGRTGNTERTPGSDDSSSACTGAVSISRRTRPSPGCSRVDSVAICSVAARPKPMPLMKVMASSAARTRLTALVSWAILEAASSVTGRPPASRNRRAANLAAKGKARTMPTTHSRSPRP